MSKGWIRFLIVVLVVCLVALGLCTWYYSEHPEEADRGIVATMEQIDNA